MNTMVLTTAIFWSFDICVSCATGFHAGGVIEMRPLRIITHYLKTWFIMDAFLVASDWFLILLFTGSSFADVGGIVRMTKALRLARILRSFRLLRVVRILQTVDVLWDVAQSEVPALITGLTRFAFTMVFVNHFIACAWYAIGDSGRSDSWVAKFEDEFGKDASFLFRYSTAFHWSLTQFTPASMEVFPRNQLERMFNVCVLICAFVMISSIISSVTNAVNSLRRVSGERTRQQELVKQYITQKRVSLELSTHIYSFLRKHCYGSIGRGVLREEDVDAFALLPNSMRMALRCEVHQPVLLRSPFFFHLCEVDSLMTSRLCHIAIKERSLTTRHELFNYGELAKGLYIVLVGLVEYYFGDHTVMDVYKHLEQNDHIASMSLWVKWEHHGRVVALENCELLLMESQAFRQVAVQHLGAAFCQAYARLFRGKIIERLAGDLGLTDLALDHDVEQELAQRAWDDVWEATSPLTSNRSPATLRPKQTSSKSRWFRTKSFGTGRMSPAGSTRAR